MAHPDPQRAGAERDQRRHAGQTGEASDLGQQDKSQSHPGTNAPQRQDKAQASQGASQGSSGSAPAKDDEHFAPESGDKPEAAPAATRPQGGQH